MKLKLEPQERKEIWKMKTIDNKVCIEINRTDILCDNCNSVLKIQENKYHHWWQFWKTPPIGYQYKCPKCGQITHNEKCYPIIRTIKEWKV